ncbi:MAG: NADPH-dependent FMN reductase [Gemmatimonadaceae bacterium]
MENICHILMICGSLRSGSTNAAVLHTVEDIVRGTAAGSTTGGLADSIADRVSVSIYDGLDRLPHFNPDADHDPLDPTVVDLRTRIGSADAILFSTPEYAGALPGSFKNLLDWTVGGVEICDKPVAWVNTSTAPTGAANAHDSLRKVLGYTGAEIVEAACTHVPVPRQAVDPDGLIRDPVLRAEITTVVTALADHAERRR